MCFLLLALTIWFSAFPQNDSATVRVADIVYVPTISDVDTALIKHYFTSQDELNTVLSIREQKKMRHINFKIADLVCLPLCRKCVDYRFRNLMLKTYKTDTSFVWNNTTTPHKGKCEFRNYCFLVKKLQNNRIHCPLLMKSLQRCKGVPRLIQNDSIYRFYKDTCGVHILSPIDFDKNMIVVFYAMADFKAQFEADVFIDKKQHQYKCILYNYDGGSAGMGFFSLWFLAPALPKGYKFTQKLVRTGVDMYIDE